MSNVFVIIVTYNGKRWYDKCIGSLRKSSIPVQTIVVDNGSSDKSVEYIQTNFPEVKIFDIGTNLGFGQGNNKGMKYALDHGADYIFLLNQDAWIEPNTIADLVRIHQNNSEYGILSPVNLDITENNILDGFIELLTDHNNVDKKWVNDLYFNRLEDVYLIKSVNAAAWLLPHKTLTTVGGFDPIFFHYGEDDNYLQRVFYHGFKVGICPMTKITHDAESSQPYNYHLKKDLYKRIILIQCGDINNLLMPQLYFRVLISRLLRKGISFKKKTFFYTLNELRYLLYMRKAIMVSRRQNKKKFSSWL
jgi:GT2 family glycosyltransferase